MMMKKRTSEKTEKNSQPCASRRFVPLSLTLNLSSFFFRDVPSAEADPISSTRTGFVEVVAGGEGEEEEEATSGAFFGLLDGDLAEETILVVVLGVHALRRAAAAPGDELIRAEAEDETMPERIVEARIISERNRENASEEEEEEREKNLSLLQKRRCLFFLLSCDFFCSSSFCFPLSTRAPHTACRAS